MLSYSKIYLYKNILGSKLPDEEYLLKDLYQYFPEKLQKKYGKYICNHNLKREIIATNLTNNFINHLGITFFNRLSENTGLKMSDIAMAYIVARDSFNLSELWKEVESLSDKIDCNTQIKMFSEISILVERSTAWFIRFIPQPISDIGKLVEEFGSKISKIVNNLENLLVLETKQVFEKKLSYYKERNVPVKIAKKIASMDIISMSSQIAYIAGNKNFDIINIGKIYFYVGAKLDLRYLRQMAEQLTSKNYWQKLSIKNLINSFFDNQMKITAQITNYAIRHKMKSGNIDKLLNNWIEYNKSEMDRWCNFMIDLKSQENVDFIILTVAVNRLKSLSLK